MLPVCADECGKQIAMLEAQVSLDAPDACPCGCKVCRCEGPMPGYRHGGCVPPLLLWVGPARAACIKNDSDWDHRWAPGC